MNFSFIGREDELRTLRQWLSHSEKRLITVTGPGGVGKTRLALEVAASLDGIGNETTVVLLDQDPAIALDAIPTPDLVLSAVSRKLKLPEVRDQPLLDQLILAFGHQPHLLLLDNFEHVLEAAPVVSALIANCPALKILVTSREALRLQLEYVYVLRPLAGLNLANPSLAAVECSPAGALFLEQARAANPAFTPSESDAAAIAEICTHLGGLPLALELAAARLSVLSPAELAHRLDQHLLRLLEGQGRDMPGRLLSMRESVAWGYDLLTPDERLLFRRISLFVGGFTLGAAERVAGNGDELWVEQALEALIAKSLVQHADVSPAFPRSEILRPRFEMLEPIREFAIGRLDDAEREETERQRANWCLDLCAAVSPNLFSSHLYGDRSLEWEQRLEEEYGNLRVVLAWAIERGEVATTLRLAGTLSDFWYRHGPLTEGHHWLQAVRELATHSTADDVKVLAGAALVAASGGYLKVAATCAEQALSLARQTENPWAVAEALAILGNVAAAREDHGEAYRLHQEALHFFREVGDAAWTGTTLLNLALSALRLQKPEAAATLIAESVSIAREVGDPWLITHTLRGAGCVACYRGDVAGATEAFAECLELSHGRTIADRWHRADALASCAMLAWLRKEPDRAARLFGAAEALYTAVGVHLPPPDRPMYATARAAVVDALAPHAEHFVREGATSPSEAAVAEANELLTAARESAKDILSDRETEVLRLLARGMSDRAISQALHISVRTAQDHAQAIRGKLGVDSRTKAVTEGQRRGLL